MPPLSAAKPSFTVDLDKPRQVRFNWQALCRFEDVYGQPITSIASNAGARSLTYLTWAGLLHDEPKLTIADVEKRINARMNRGGSLKELVEQLMAALSQSGLFGAPEKKDEDAPESDEPTLDDHLGNASAPEESL